MDGAGGTAGDGGDDADGQTAGGDTLPAGGRNDDAVTRVMRLATGHSMASPLSDRRTYPRLRAAVGAVRVAGGTRQALGT